MIGTGLYRLYCWFVSAAWTWAGVSPTSAARLPMTAGCCAAATRDSVICSVTLLPTRGLPLRSRMSPLVGVTGTERIWLATTAWAAAGACRTWSAHSRRPSRAKRPTMTIATMRSRRPGRDSVVSGASSTASIEKRLGRIRGWRLFALAGLVPPDEPKIRF